MKDTHQEMIRRMDKTITVLLEDFDTVRAGRANPAVLNKLQVDYYGVATPLSQIGNISVPDPRTLLIQPWDAAIIGAIEKAIQASELGINPTNDGRSLRLNFPPLTEERRKELVKLVAKHSEEAKVAIRSIRRDAIEHYKSQKKNSEITEDDLRDLEKDVQVWTDKKIKEIDDLTTKKNKEIMEV